MSKQPKLFTSRAWASAGRARGGHLHPLARPKWYVFDDRGSVKLISLGTLVWPPLSLVILRSYKEEAKGFCDDCT